MLVGLSGHRTGNLVFALVCLSVPLEEQLPAWILQGGAKESPQASLDWPWSESSTAQGQR